MWVFIVFIVVWQFITLIDLRALKREKEELLKRIRDLEARVRSIESQQDDPFDDNPFDE